MLYECSCGFNASTATQFYKHLAASGKGSGHQLVHAKLGDGEQLAASSKGRSAAQDTKNTTGGGTAPETKKPGSLSSWVEEGASPKPKSLFSKKEGATTKPKSLASWVDEYVSNTSGFGKAGNSNPLAKPDKKKGGSLGSTDDDDEEYKPEHSGSGSDFDEGIGGRGSAYRATERAVTTTTRAGATTTRAAAAAAQARFPAYRVGEVPGNEDSPGNAHSPQLAGRPEPAGSSGIMGRADSWKEGTLRRRVPTSVAAQPLELEEVHLDLTHNNSLKSPLATTSPQHRTPATRTASGQAASVAANLLSVMTLGFNPMTLFSNKGSGSGHLQDYDHAAAGAGQGGQQDNAMQGGGAEAGGGARGGADGAVGLSTSQAIIGRADVGAISNLESVLMWRNPWRSARFLGGGLYLMVCVQQLGRGSELLLSPTTAVLAFAFILLLFNMVRVAVTRLKDHRQSHHGQAEGGDAAGGEQGERERVSRQSGYGLGMRGSEEKGHWGEGGAARPSLTMQRALEQERVVYERAHTLFAGLAAAAVPMAAAAVALLYRAVSGRRLVTSVMVGVSLWAGMLLGELRLVSQTTFLALLYILLFTAPVLYVRSRHALDVLVEDVLRYITRVLLQGDRTATFLSLGALLATMLWAPFTNFVLRATMALLAGFAMLVWRTMPRTALPPSSAQPAEMAGEGAAGVGARPVAEAHAVQGPPSMNRITYGQSLTYGQHEAVGHHQRNVSRGPIIEEVLSD